MNLNQLSSISPIDGRYHSQTHQLSEYFSEYALMKYRLIVEVEYFISLGEKKLFRMSSKLAAQLRELANEFSLNDAETIKHTEAVTNHDVKAVEYFLKGQLERLGAGALKEWVHFGLTSQDINNTAIPYFGKIRLNAYLPAIKPPDAPGQTCRAMERHSMLAEPMDSPLRLRASVRNCSCLRNASKTRVQLFSYIPFTGKFGGATGNFNAHYVAYQK